MGRDGERRGEMERGRGEMRKGEGGDGEGEGRDGEGEGRDGRGGGEMGRGEGSEWPGIKLPSNLLCTATPMSGNLKGIVINSCCGLRLLLDKPPSLILLTSNTQIPHENKPSVVGMLHFL